jgi:hypothetical protein|nr:MAG TPA: hypothetical protein [Caudoviricetes sp.]
MNENILLSMVAELNKQLSDKTLGEIEFKARFTDLQAQVAQLAQEVENYRNTIESDAELKALFDKIKNKNEVTK